MKKIVVLILACLFSFLVIGCNDEDTSNTPEEEITTTPPPAVTYLSEDDLIFGAGCDHALIEKYFLLNGIEEDGAYTINGSTCSVKFYPKTKKFVIAYVYIKNDSLSIGNFQQIMKYTYIGGVELQLNQSLTKAKYTGYYTHDATALGSSNYAYYEAKFVFDNVKYVALTDLSSFDNVTCTGTIVYATDYQKAKEHFDKNTIGETCYQCVEACFIALDELFKMIDSDYVIAGKYISPRECVHSVVIDEGYSATCLKEGLTDGKHCSKCNVIIEKQNIIPIQEHEEVLDKGRSATCLEEGLTDGKHCARCETIILKQEKIPALHDNLSGEECSFCHEMIESKGLEFLPLGSCYVVSGIGTCMDSCIVIPSEYKGLPVEYIGGGAFKDNKKIEKVVVPNNVKYINWSAFENCINLNEIQLPSTLKEISDNAFAGCISLTSITIPRSVTGIENYAFYRCDNLKSLIFEDISTWYITKNVNYWENKVCGTVIDVSDFELIATFIKTNSDYYWYKL